MIPGTIFFFFRFSRTIVARIRRHRVDRFFFIFFLVLILGHKNDISLGKYAADFIQEKKKERIKARTLL